MSRGGLDVVLCTGGVVVVVALSTWSDEGDGGEIPDSFGESSVLFGLWWWIVWWLWWRWWVWGWGWGRWWHRHGHGNGLLWLTASSDESVDCGGEELLVNILDMLSDVFISFYLSLLSLTNREDFFPFIDNCQQSISSTYISGWFINIVYITRFITYRQCVIWKKMDGNDIATKRRLANTISVILSQLQYNMYNKKEESNGNEWIGIGINSRGVVSLFSLFLVEQEQRYMFFSSSFCCCVTMCIKWV